MDARDLSELVFKLWQEKYPKDSGTIHKSLKKVPVAVWTEHGYREVVGAHINDLGFIELELEQE
jgi:hypothetical protein